MVFLFLLLSWIIKLYWLPSLVFFFNGASGYPSERTFLAGESGKYVIGEVVSFFLCVFVLLAI